MKNFIKTSLLGGLVVMLPITILGFFFKWLFRLVTDLIQPLTDYASRLYPFPEIVADILVILIILLSCFFIGVVVSTKLGNFLHQTFDDWLQKLAPGYRMVKEVVVQLLGSSENSPFRNGMVARVKIFGMDSPTEVTALVVDRSDPDIFTVFVPTGPNPTSGNIFHVNKEQVVLYPNVKLDSTMRTVIACGAGSGELFKAD
ncbi:MAG: DUF502 domain-containing protein [Gammaproteobacteria bacterium]|nr:DUF502 domain-containing protein [Gammaproteobacteria bacterium]